MTRWRWLGWVALFAAGVSVAGPPQAGFDLLSAEEAIAWNTPRATPEEAYRQREIGAPGMPNCHAVPTAADAARTPQIKIMAPALDKPLLAPLDIDLRFVASGAAIRPDTFKVCYIGFVVMDITNRVTDHVSVSADGLHVAGANLPRGHHHLVMMIADQQGAIGSRDAIFDIK